MIRPLNDRENDLDFHFHNDLRGDRTMGHSLKRSLAVMLVCVFAIQPLAFAGIGNETTMYVGGTKNQIKEGTEGKSSEKSETTFRFTYKHGELVIPYDQINDLEYGQKAGRRLGVAIALTPLALLSKKEKAFFDSGLERRTGQTARSSV